MRVVKNDEPKKVNSSLFRKIVLTAPLRSTILIRLMVGGVFYSEGLQKLLFPIERGAGRFKRIGLPSPEFLGELVGGFELICGLFILGGFLVRLASLPLIIIMLVAIWTTKIPMMEEEGFWEMLHASRTDWSMLLGSIFLTFKGGGYWSVDSILQGKK